MQLCYPELADSPWATRCRPLRELAAIENSSWPATLLRRSLQLLQLLDCIRVLGVQLKRLFVVLNCKLLVAVYHVGFPKAVVGIEALGKHLNVELENLNRILDSFHLHELVAETIKLPLAKVISVLLSRLQLTILLDRCLHIFLDNSFDESLGDVARRRLVGPAEKDRGDLLGHFPELGAAR